LIINSEINIFEVWKRKKNSIKMNFRRYKKDSYIPHNFCSPETQATVEVIEIPLNLVKPNSTEEKFQGYWGFDGQKFISEFSKNVNSLIKNILQDEAVYTKCDIGTFHEYPIYKEIETPEGHTLEEYEKATGKKRHLPYDDGDIIIDTNDDGKICFFKPNGDLSVSMGAPCWNKNEGKVDTTIQVELPYRVKFINHEFSKSWEEFESKINNQ
jgi:hypothetical protein